MKLVKLTISMIAVLVFSFTAQSFTKSKDLVINQQPNKSKNLVSSYIQIKNALAADNSKGAAEAASKMVITFAKFDISDFTSAQQKELKDIIENANEQAEHISDSPIGHQREHFVTLSEDMVDLIAITGTEMKLYQDFCPMANGSKGAIWLSEIKEIRNPFMGSKMLTCGSIQKEI